jgi:hypothetical protein
MAGSVTRIERVACRSLYQKATKIIYNYLEGLSICDCGYITPLLFRLGTECPTCHRFADAIVFDPIIPDVIYKQLYGLEA